MDTLQIATKLRPDRKAMDTAYSAGFRHAEFWLDESLLLDWKKVASMAQDVPLRCRMHFPNRGDLSEAAVEGAVRLYDALDSSAMVIHAPMLRRYRSQLLEKAPHMRLGVENHRLRPDEFQHWAAQNEWLTLDVEHLWKLTLQDCPLHEMLRYLEDSFLTPFGEKLVHVHMPGYLPGRDEHRPMYCSREMALAVFDILADYDFDGFIVSEVNLEFQNANELQMDVLLYQRWRELRQARFLSP